MASNKTIATLMLITLISLVAVGCSDDNSVTAVTPPPAPVDTAPPAVPTGVAVEMVDGVAVLSWDRNTTDSDLDGYIITRDSELGSVDLIASPTLVQSYQDTNPVTGSNIYYIYSVDYTGNQSAGSSVDLLNAGTHDREIHLD